MTNDDIARKLRAHANELARRGDNLYRVRSFRQAALAVMGLTEDVRTLVGRSGTDALADVPGIGASLAETIEVYAISGVWAPRTGTNERGWRTVPTPKAHGLRQSLPLKVEATG